MNEELIRILLRRILAAVASNPVPVLNEQGRVVGWVYRALVCLLVSSGVALAAEVNLAWDASPSSNVTGYHIYYGTTPNSTEHKIVNVGPATTATITGLLDNTTYYFTATAYFESPHSNQITWGGWSGIKYYPRASFTSRMVGGVFEGTNGDPTTGSYTKIHTITTNPPLAWTEVTVSLGNYRYLRYRGPDGSHGNVAEIEFYCNGVKLTGAGYGTPGYWLPWGTSNPPTFDKALDGNVNTLFDAPEPNGAFVGIDTATP